MALELLTRPSLLFLDEPTSGLDPANDQSVMETLKGLAKGGGAGSSDEGGRTVIVVTHSVLFLDLCDYILVLARVGTSPTSARPTGRCASSARRTSATSRRCSGSWSARPAPRWRPASAAPSTSCPRRSSRRPCARRPRHCRACASSRCPRSSRR
ncbi:AAA family ATPase [Parafrankia sp. CH37]|uniref:AAA family ATPase n=1 Tax=Parafrankia sp. CH37 TaxID=683308 RepID=UPI0037CB02A8